MCKLRSIVLAVSFVLVASVSAWADVAIDETNFPDDVFREYVRSHFDTDGDGMLNEDEINAVTTIDVNNKGISSLRGVENFSALTYLHCEGNLLASNQLTSLDVSHNTALRALYCEQNQLTELNVSHNTALTTLECGSNQLTSLDVSHNTALTSLSCGSNSLTSLDVSHNTALSYYLQCEHNQLTALDVSNNNALTILDCGFNQLEALDVSNNTALTRLYCYNNQLAVLDVSHNTSLSNLRCYSQDITVASLERTGRTDYPYSLNMTALSSALDISRVQSLSATNSSGSTVNSFIDTGAGVVYFVSRPQTVTYIYDIGYSGIYNVYEPMNVTITFSSADDTASSNDVLPTSRDIVSTDITSQDIVSTDITTESHDIVSPDNHVESEDTTEPSITSEDQTQHETVTSEDQSPSRQDPAPESQDVTPTDDTPENSDPEPDSNTPSGQDTAPEDNNSSEQNFTPEDSEPEQQPTVVPENGSSSGTTSDPQSELPLGTIRPVESDDTMLEKIAETTNLPEDEIIFLKEENITAPQEPTRGINDYVKSDSHKIIGKLNTVTVNRDGYYVFKIVLSDELYEQVKNVSVKNLKIYALYDDGMTGASAFRPSIINGLLATWELLTLNGEKMEFGLKEFLMVGFLNAGAPFSVFIAKLILAMFGGGGCEIGLGIAGVAILGSAFFVFRRLRK